MARSVEHLRIGVFAALLLLGLGTGTIAEQRARLPPPAECTDPVVGVWKSHTFSEHIGRWDEFHLDIRRDDSDPSALVGRVRNHAWTGRLSAPQPPADCQDISGSRTRWSTEGRGRAEGNHVKFWGTGRPRVDANICGHSTADTYNLDHFEGTIDPELQEFQSLNNDGGVHVNFPIVFRRIDCLSGNEAAMTVEPPPFQPPANGLGCSLW